MFEKVAETLGLSSSKPLSRLDKPASEAGTSMTEEEVVELYSYMLYVRSDAESMIKHLAEVNEALADRKQKLYQVLSSFGVSDDVLKSNDRQVSLQEANIQSVSSSGSNLPKAISEKVSEIVEKARDDNPIPSKSPRRQGIGVSWDTFGKMTANSNAREREIEEGLSNLIQEEADISKEQEEVIVDLLRSFDDIRSELSEYRETKTALLQKLEPWRQATVKIVQSQPDMNEIDNLQGTYEAAAQNPRASRNEVSRKKTLAKAAERLRENYEPKDFDSWLSPKALSCIAPFKVK
jgi:septal ring factor EnvC (AmiA/AmiB activator)